MQMFGNQTQTPSPDPSMSRPRPTSARCARACPLLLVGLLLAPCPGGAQTPQARVLAFGESTSGLALEGEVLEGGLEAGGERLFPVVLAGGQPYTVVGFCDGNCQDLDLALVDPTGNTLEMDVMADAEPVLMFTTHVQGTFQVRVIMVTCEMAPCAYAVGVYAGGSGGAAELSGGTPGDLSYYRREFEAQGFVELGEVGNGGLSQGQEMRLPVRLRGRMDYRLLGICDSDCTDLDLLLLGPDGEELDSDLLADPFPIVEASPTADAEYRLGAIMVACSVEPCGFRIIGFARGEGAVPGGLDFTGTVVADTTFEGALEITDLKLREGEIYDEYFVDAKAGQRIIADLRSGEFDTYLILEAPGGESERNDDHEGETNRSHVEMIASVDGTYSILVTTFGAGITGSYNLRVVVTEGSGG